MTGYLIAVGVLVALIAAFAVWLRQRQGTVEAPPLGIVLLLRQARVLSATDVAEVFGRVSRALFLVIHPQAGKPFGPSDLPKCDLVFGESPSFLVQAAGDLFVVNSVDKPYGADLEGLEVREHQAWLSIEILHPEAVSAANYRIVGQVAAELLSDDCIALYHPESRTVAANLPEETAEQLRTENPLHTVFGRLAAEQGEQRR